MKIFVFVANIQVIEILRHAGKIVMYKRQRNTLSLHLHGAPHGSAFGPVMFIFDNNR